MNEQSKQEWGGKGYALEELRQAGFNVPTFVVIPSSFFRNIDKSGDANAEIASACQRMLPAWQKQFAGKLLAVRSSAVAEDSAAHSFAGQFKTLLNVPPDGLAEAVAEVWLSLKGANAYTTAHGIREETEMAVVLQEMVEATAAGVAFSANPVTGTEEIIINAVSGLGDKLVDGSANADSYAVLHGAVMNRQAAGQSCVLNDTQVLQMAAEATRAHKHFGGPQDLEFAFHGETLYILQSRPVTTLPKTATVWDNSNIVESYPGLTQPLTFSFIEKMYEAVYRQFSALLGVSNGKIERHADAFANMLGLLNGRVYYNLNSWYQALALLPGYSLNAAAMEKMMGVKEKPDISIAPDKTSKLKAWWEVTTAVFSILRRLRTARKGAQDFTRSFNEVYAAYAAQDFQTKSLSELWQHYTEFEDLMVRRWKAPLVNDFFAMIYFGLLQKQCASIAPEDANLHNRLLAGSDAVLTTQPMKELPKIVDAVRKQPALLQIAVAASEEEFYHALQRPEYASAWKLFTDYIAVWGERSVAELKLETMTYQQNPLLLAGLLQSYLRGGMRETSASNYASKDKAVAEALVDIKLRGKWMKRKLFAHVLRQARYFVTQRENLRYYRTRGFGMVRRMMIAIGQRLSESGVIETARDVFWLKLPEIEQQINAPASMAQTVAQRKAAYENYERAGLPQRIISYGKPNGLISLQPVVRYKPVSEKILQGIPCSAGVVRAKVYPVKYSDELKSLNGAILATYATDPGFVVLFASASGILTERGSLLSHAAIVSREMGIPCIVGIDGLMERLKDGAVVEMDGSTGIVTILDNE